MKFKKGDKLKLIKKGSWTDGLAKGGIYTVRKVSSDGDIGVKEQRPHYWIDQSFFKKVTKSMKNKKITHIVKWDETEGDPINECSSLKEAQRFVKELLDDENCIKDSIRVFEVKSVGRVKVEIVFNK